MMMKPLFFLLFLLLTPVLSFSATSNDVTEVTIDLRQDGFFSIREDIVLAPEQELYLHVKNPQNKWHLAGDSYDPNVLRIEMKEFNHAGYDFLGSAMKVLLEREDCDVNSLTYYFKAGDHSTSVNVRFYQEYYPTGNLRGEPTPQKKYCTPSLHITIE
jgi:hypothetical protein